MVSVRNLDGHITPKVSHYLVTLSLYRFLKIESSCLKVREPHSNRQLLRTLSSSRFSETKSFKSHLFLIHVKILSRDHKVSVTRLYG